jgi:4-carboxymuconolactone decarboxylase
MTTAAPDDRYRNGLTRMHETGGVQVTSVFLDALSGIAPDLGRYVVEFLYGDLHRRPGLAPRDRQLITLATLAALGGCERQLALHIGVALNLGISPESIVEVFIHQSGYAGFPRALNAVLTAGDVLDDFPGADSS